MVFFGFATTCLKVDDDMEDIHYRVLLDIQA